MKWLFLLLLPSALYGLSVTSGITPIAGTGTHSNPLLAVSINGSAAAVWTEGFPNKVEVAYFNGMSWTAPVVLDNGSFPKIGIDGKGNAIVVWLGTSNLPQIFASRFTPATGWSAPVMLSVGGANAAPQVAVNSGGNALAIWVQATPQQLLVGSTFNVSTGVWSSPVALVTGTGSFPQVGLDDQNRGVILFTDSQFQIDAFTVQVP